MMADALDTEELKTLLSREDAPGVSIYVPLETIPQKWEENRLRFREAASKAKKLLEEAESGDEETVSELEDRLDAIVADEAMWQRLRTRGLAVFLTPGDFQKMYTLPAAFEPTTVVGQTLHTLPLIEYMRSPERYYLLGISQKEIALWEGTRDAIRHVEVPEMPSSLEDFYGEYESSDTLGFHSTGASGTKPAFHGQRGSGDLEEEADLLPKLYRATDEALRNFLGQSRAPVILAGTERNRSMYREHSGLAHLTDETLTGHVFDSNTSELQDKARPIVESFYEQRIDEILDRWGGAIAEGKSEEDLATIAKVAVQGRIGTLLTEAGRHVWGKMDREFGDIEILETTGDDDPSAETIDLIDEIAEVVLAFGGDVVAVRPDRMPSSTGAAAILR
jgi:hypothetical protein